MKKFISLIVMFGISFITYAQTSIAGVSFGSDFKTAQEILKNKFGTPEYDSDVTSIHYTHKEYGGLYFDDMFFDFKNSGFKSYFCKCVFLIRTKTSSQAIERRDIIARVVSKYYKLDDEINRNGYKVYWGGDDPTDSTKYGFFIDVLPPDIKGGFYYARLFYGPYNYVTENF